MNREIKRTLICVETKKQIEVRIQEEGNCWGCQFFDVASYSEYCENSCTMFEKGKIDFDHVSGNLTPCKECLEFFGEIDNEEAVRNENI